MLEVTGGAWKTGADTTGSKATVFEPFVMERGSDQLLTEVANSILMKELAANEAANKPLVERSRSQRYRKSRA